MKGKYIFESYKEFMSEYTKAKGDYDKANDEAKRLWGIVKDSAGKYRKEFVDLFKSLNPDRIYHPSVKLRSEDIFYLDLKFNISSKSDTLSVLEKIILKFEDLQSDGYEMKLSVSLYLYAEREYCFASMETDDNYFYFKNSNNKYKEFFIRLHLLEEIVDYNSSQPQSIGSIVSFLNKFEDILEKGEDIYTRAGYDDDGDNEEEPEYMDDEIDDDRYRRLLGIGVDYDEEEPDHDGEEEEEEEEGDEEEPETDE